MTDEENQRQRHLAEMAIAQCDGKIVQFENNPGQWMLADKPILRFAWFKIVPCNVRIKPDPREWWICDTCNLRRAYLLKSPHFPHHGNTICTGSIVHVREVLGD